MGSQVNKFSKLSHIAMSKVAKFYASISFFIKRSSGLIWGSICCGATCSLIWSTHWHISLIFFLHVLIHHPKTYFCNGNHYYPFFKWHRSYYTNWKRFYMSPISPYVEVWGFPFLIVTQYLKSGWKYVRAVLQKSTTTWVVNVSPAYISNQTNYLTKCATCFNYHY